MEIMTHDHNIHDTGHKFTLTEIWNKYQNFLNEMENNKFSQKHFKK
jgi:hypothetical protein